jgi:hypothetical protein
VAFPPSKPKQLFTHWDRGLESLLSSSISAELDPLGIPWKRRTIVNADPRFDTSLVGQSSFDHPWIDNRPDILERQQVIARAINAPLSPRKPGLRLKTLSTSTKGRTKAMLRDHRVLETVVEKREVRANSEEGLGLARKADIRLGMRKYTVHVNPALRSSFERTHWERV